MMKFNGEIKRLDNEGLTLFYGEPLILHCNHYNLFLQRTIEDAGAYIPAAEILVRGGVMVAYAMFRRLFEEHPHIRAPRARLQVASDLYAQLGFGRLWLETLTAITPPGARWRR